MKYFIKTFGCQINEADSERIASCLAEKGFEPAKDASSANLVIINSCSVRESAENRVFGLVNNLSKLKKKPRLLLTGCLVGSAKGENRRYSLKQLQEKTPGVDEYKTLQEILGKEKSLDYPREDKKHAYVKIMEGCNNYCSYCVVPYARGREVSLPFAEIICEIKNLAKKGYREITLLG